MQHWQQQEQQLKEFIEQEMETDPAHDLNHVKRVVAQAQSLAIAEQADLNIVIPAAYLHDCINLPKNHAQRGQASVIAADKSIRFLKSINYPEKYYDDIHHCISAHSFSAGIAATTIEAKVVQDADRLDAIGAIGIARCIQVSTQFNSQLYNEKDPFCQQRKPNDKEYTIDHFYVKLFAICNSLHTPAAQIEGDQRKQYMQLFMDQLSKEISPL